MQQEPIRNKYGETILLPVETEERYDESGEGLALELATAGSMNAGTPSQVADEFLRKSLPGMGLGSTYLAGDDTAALTEAVTPTASIHYSHERDVAGSTVVVYNQLVLGLPVFNARIGVDIDQSTLKVVSAQSSVHGNVVVVNADQIKAPNKERKLGAAALKKLLHVDLPKLADGRVERQVVYRYEPDERLEPDDDKPQGCFSEAPKPDYKLRPVPASIKAGSHYVVNEVLFKAARGPEEPQVNWRALVEPKTGAVLYFRALVAGAATGMVMLRDPQVQTGAAVTGASTTAVLDPFRSNVVLPGVVNATPQNLAGNFVRLADTSAPTIAAPTVANPPAAFTYHVPTDDFAAVNAYYHCDNCFRTMQNYGFNVGTYFNNTSFPVPVDHRALGTVVNAQAPGNSTGNGSGGFLFALLQSGTPVGIAASNGVVWHEFGHALLWDNVSSPNFGFAHSAGDTLAAIFHDPGSKAPDRFDTFPWVQAGTPLNRRHDRAVSAGWGWFGANYNTQYQGEQILSTTLFRLYRSIGGDALTVLSTQRRASETTAFLIFKAIGLLTSTTPDPRIFVAKLETADKTTTAFKGIAGGALHKVIRWAFEKQGLFQPNAVPGMGNTVTREGNPPDVDVYIDDGRKGEYTYQPVHWNCQDVWVRRAPDGGTTHQAPRVGLTNYVYVRVKNRGTQTATNVRVKAFQADPGTGLSFPNDWTPMSTAILNASGPIPSGGQTIVGPFKYVPVHVGHECLLAIAQATGDPGNDTTITGSIPEHRLVPFDNNMGQRNVNPILPSLRELVKYFREHLVVVRNPSDRTVRCNVEIELPKFLRELGWSMRASSPGGVAFELPAHGARKVVLNIVAGREFTPEIARQAIARGDGTILVRTFLDKELSGGMSYPLMFDRGIGLDEENEIGTEPEPERLPAPSIDQILSLAGEGARNGDKRRRVKTVRIEFDLDE